MLSKTNRKRLHAAVALETLPRVSQPPEKLKTILEGVSGLPPIDFDLPRVSESLRDVANGRITLADVLTANPSLGELAIPGTLKDYLNAVVLLQWAKQLRLIARGQWLGFLEVAYSLDKNGGFTLKRDPLVDALNACGKDHDLRHLRECAVADCKRIFWAKKLPKEQLVDPKAKVGCSDRCKNILRVRRCRADRDADQTRTKQVRLPSADVIASVQRALKFLGPNFTINQLAQDQEISVAECKRILNHLEEKRARTTRRR